mgnify:CR=1 FL=1
MNNIEVFKELQKEIHQIAKSKGWYRKKPTVGELIALCHSELSEALEEYRGFGKHNKKYLRIIAKDSLQDNKPVGFSVELADCIMRILDMCEYLKLDIAKAIQMKIEYNKARPYRHGNKTI